MKLEFTYTISPNLSALTKDELYYTHFELPDSILQLVDWKKRVVEFLELIFRSQLEIRFVTQLEAKQVRWVYEGERLGDGNYLVDFYLPDFRCWVEVKGRFEPRDDYLLKDVASFLKKERNERLFVYTQSKAFRVDINQFRSLTHDEFWVKIMQ